MIWTIALILTLGAPTAPDSAAAAPPEPSKDRIICRTKPALGSRITRQRICKTAEEWRIYANDLEQSRRDINDRGMRGDPDPDRGD